MAPSRKQQVIDLLKSLETKDPVPLAYVNPNKYIQHNLQVGPGPAGVDLFRIEKGRIAEHWDTLEAIPPRDQWQNSNGKF
jgi:predicted SnoaL-like aldol condensation-catalyzing enzyme